jgi:hypothetical protein
MLEARYGHTATLLASGVVLVAGGVPLGAEHVAPVGSNLATAELYTSTSRSWATTGAMSDGRAKHTATLLDDGTVLVTRFGPLGSTQRYDPETGSWSVTQDPDVVRYGPTATLLADGRVLVVGGYGDDAGSGRAAELFDLVSGRWIATTDLGVARDGHTSTLLTDGTVLVAGGTTGNVKDSAEVFDPGEGF